jgi:hypothetical protein
LPISEVTFVNIDDSQRRYGVLLAVDETGGRWVTAVSG